MSLERRRWAYSLLVDRAFTSTSELTAWADEVEKAMMYACDDCKRAWATHWGKN